MKAFFKLVGDFLNWVFKAIQGLGSFTVGFFVILTLILLIDASLTNKRPTVPDGAVLVLNPQGVVMEQKPVRKAFQQTSVLGNRVIAETVHDILRAIRRAKDDDRISGLAIYTNGFAGAGMTLLNEMADAIRSFKESGKPVYAISAAYTQSSYLLAAEADEIYLDTKGSVFLRGFGFYPMYYKDLIEKVEATIEVFRVGTYKSAIEPYTRDSMSEPVKASNQDRLDTMWGDYTGRLAGARDALQQDTINTNIAQIGARLEAAGGDMAQMAMMTGLVDQVGPRSLWRKALIEKHGADASGDTFNQINHILYLQAIGPDISFATDEIAVITAQGLIVPGSGPMTVAASGTVVNYIRDARLNPRTKAIIMRIDSPGGSDFASEQIRQELESAKEQGIPVIASMGSIAASGGYVIAAPADKIIAHPSTITGSIGVFAVLPTYPNTLKKVGVSIDGVATSEVAAGLNAFKGLNDTTRQLFQMSVEDTYRDFVQMVADNRDMSFEDVDTIAQGRVWMGRKALELGLVDQLGSFQDAIDAAAEAGETTSYKVRFYREEQDPFDAWLIDALDGLTSVQASVDIPITVDDPRQVQLDFMGQQSAFETLLEASRKVSNDFSISDPNGRMLLCMICKTD